MELYQINILGDSKNDSKSDCNLLSLFFAYLCGLYALFKGGDSNDSKFSLYLAINNMMHLQVY